jgi:hypothetical protein
MGTIMKNGVLGVLLLFVFGSTGALYHLSFAASPHNEE